MLNFGHLKLAGFFIIGTLAFNAIAFFSAIQIDGLSYSVIATPETVNLTGENSGNISQYALSFDLDELSAIKQINSAKLQYELIGSSNATVLFYDKYTISVNPISISLPLIVGQLSKSGFQSYDLTAQFNAWLAHPENNLGLLLKVNELEANTNISLASVQLLIDYEIKDVTAPLISEIDAQKQISNKYLITAKSNEAVQVTLEYGKTSNYTMKMESQEYLSDIFFELDNLQSGISYHYRLIAKDIAANKTVTQDKILITNGSIAGLTSKTSLEAIDIKIDPGLAAPSEFKVNFDEIAKFVHLTWEASSNGGTLGYIVYRSDDKGVSFYELSRTTSSQTSFDDGEISSGLSVQYQIRAFSVSGVSTALKSNAVEIPIKEATIENNVDARYPLLLSLIAGALIVTMLVLFIWKKLIRVLNWLKLPQPNKPGLHNKLHDPYSAS